GSMEMPLKILYLIEDLLPIRRRKPDVFALNNLEQELHFFVVALIAHEALDMTFDSCDVLAIFCAFPLSNNFARQLRKIRGVFPPQPLQWGELTVKAHNLRHLSTV